jgi:two-component system cell cycle sensor histidine kinase/response regulator CckA
LIIKAGDDEKTKLYHRRKDGSLIAVEINTSRVTFGTEELMLAIVRDISERRQSENERQRLQDQLNQARKMESVGRLAGGVAHDFNNMLGIIIGHAELAMMQVPPASSLYNSMFKFLGRPKGATILAFA